MSGAGGLRWGILGTGRITNRVVGPLMHGPGSPRNTVVAVASRDASRAAAYAAEHGIAVAHGAYEALLEDTAVDAVYIALPNHLHVPWTIRALEAGKHVLCEKPLALTPEDVDAVAAASATTDRVAMEAFMYLHHPQTRRVLELVRSGAIGELLAVQARFSFVLTYPNDPRADVAMGGGSLWDLGGYPVSYARRLAGSDPVEVHASTRRGPTGVDLTAAAQLRYESGVVAQLVTSFGAPDTEHLHVIGSAGELVVDPAFVPGLDGRSSVITLRRPDGVEAIEIPHADPYLAEIENLAAAVLDGAPQELPLSETRGNVATLASLYADAGFEPWPRSAPGA